MALHAVPYTHRDDWPLSWLERVRTSVRNQYWKKRARESEVAERHREVAEFVTSSLWTIELGTEVWTLAATSYGFLAVRRDLDFPPAPARPTVAREFYRYVVRGAHSSDICRMTVGDFKRQLVTAPAKWSPSDDDPLLRVPQPVDNGVHDRRAFAKPQLAIMLAGARAADLITVRLLATSDGSESRISEWPVLGIFGPGYIVMVTGKGYYVRERGEWEINPLAQDELKCSIAQESSSPP